jgi:pimeloyl-ACP methyl ester carboxylesterase
MTAQIHSRIGVVALLIALGVGSHPRAQEAAILTIETLESRPGVTERFADIVPSAPPVASLILFVGGEGRLNLAPGDSQIRSVNFLVRTSRQFAAAGYRVAVLDTPSDHIELGDFRATEDHAKDVAAVIRFLRASSPAPVWLVGTSRGSISAANAAARLAGTTEAPDGLVLTSVVTGSSRRQPTSIYAVPLSRIRIPVLIVGHRDDDCPMSPYSGGEELTRRLPNATKVELLGFVGGRAPESAPCEPLAAHGFFGIEADVVAAIGAWIKLQ